MEQVQELVKLQVVDTQWVLVVFVVPLWVVTVLLVEWGMKQVQELVKLE